MAGNTVVIFVQRHPAVLANSIRFDTAEKDLLRMVGYESQGNGYIQSIRCEPHYTEYYCEFMDFDLLYRIGKDGIAKIRSIAIFYSDQKRYKLKTSFLSIVRNDCR